MNLTMNYKFRYFVIFQTLTIHLCNNNDEKNVQ